MSLVAKVLGVYQTIPPRGLDLCASVNSGDAVMNRQVCVCLLSWAAYCNLAFAQQPKQMPSSPQIPTTTVDTPKLQQMPSSPAADMSLAPADSPGGLLSTSSCSACRSRLGLFGTHSGTASYPPYYQYVPMGDCPEWCRPRNRCVTVWFIPTPYALRLALGCEP